MVQFHSSECGCPIFPTPFVEETVFSPLDIPLCFVADSLTIELRVYFWALYSVPLINVSVFVSVPYCLDDYSFVIELEVQHCDAPGFDFLFQHSSGYLGSFLVPYKF